MAEKLPKLTRLRLKGGREVVVFADDGDTLRVIDLHADESLRIDRDEIEVVLSPSGGSDG
jgi:hypothetical protein